VPITLHIHIAQILLSDNVSQDVRFLSFLVILTLEIRLKSVAQKLVSLFLDSKILLRSISS